MVDKLPVHHDTHTHRDAAFNDRRGSLSMAGRLMWPLALWIVSINSGSSIPQDFHISFSNDGFYGVWSRWSGLMTFNGLNYYSRQLLMGYAGNYTEAGWCTLPFYNVVNFRSEELIFSNLLFNKDVKDLMSKTCSSVGNDCCYQL